MRTYRKICLYGGIIFVLLASFPLQGYAEGGDPYRVKFNLDVDFSFRPVVTTITAPYRALAFVKHQIQEQGEDVSQKTLALLSRTKLVLVRGFTSPYKAIVFTKTEIDENEQILSEHIVKAVNAPIVVTRAVKERIEDMPSQLASFISEFRSPEVITNLRKTDSVIASPPAPVIASPSPVIASDSSVIARSEATKQSQILDTKYQILNTTKEIIREVIVKETQIQDTKYSIQDTNEKLTALKTELNQSFADRLNKFSGPFGFTSNRFDDIFINKEIKVGSGNVKLATFTSIANASSTTQFSASGIEDKLSFEGSGLTTISFDSSTKKITISTPTPSLLSILQQGADASTFTGTTKIAGLTIDSSGFVILPAGTSTTPSLTFNGLTTTGLFAKTGDILGFSTAGVERLRIDGSGNVQLSGFALLPQGTSTTPSLTFSGDTDTGIFSKTPDILAFTTGGTERLRLDASGNALFAGFAFLPFGTSTTPSLAFSSDTDTGIFAKGDNILAFGTAGLERLRIDGSGNVAIGKTSADQKLDVSGTLQVTGFKLTTGATANYLLTSDASGVGTWAAPPATAWSSCASSPAFASASTFTVTNNQSSTDAYYIGRIIRYKDTAGGATFQYTAVSAYSAGTVTVADGGLDSGFTTCQSANFEPLKVTLSVSGRLPSVATNNISIRLNAAASFEPVMVNFYVEVMASTNGATAGNTTVRLRKGTDPVADGTTDVLSATNLAYNSKTSFGNNPVHTVITANDFLQIDITAAPTGGQADHLTLILYGVPQWAKNL